MNFVEERVDFLKKRKDVPDENVGDELGVVVEEARDEAPSLKKTNPIFHVNIFGQPPVVRGLDQNLVFAKYNNEDAEFEIFANSIPQILLNEDAFDRRTINPSARGWIPGDTILLSWIVDINNDGNVSCKMVKLIPSNVYTISNIMFDDKFVISNFSKLKDEKTKEYSERKKALGARAEKFKQYKTNLLNYFSNKLLKELSLIGLSKLRNKQITVVYFFMNRSANLTGLVHKDAYNHNEDLLKIPSHISVTNFREGYTTQLGFNNKLSNKMITFASKPGDTTFIRNMDHCTPLIKRSVLEQNPHEQTHKFELSSKTGDYQRTSRILELVNSGKSGLIHPDTINQIKEFESNVNSNVNSGTRMLIRTHYFDEVYDEIIERRFDVPFVQIGTITDPIDENVIAVKNPDNAIFNPQITQYGMGRTRDALHKRSKKKGKLLARKTNRRTILKKKLVTIKRGVNKNAKTNPQRIKHRGGGDEQGTITFSNSSTQRNKNSLVIPQSKEFVILMDNQSLASFRAAYCID